MEQSVKKIPNHVAFIMDGNRRWAANHMLEVWKGHENGALTVKEMIKEAVKMRIAHFSFFEANSGGIYFLLV